MERVMIRVLRGAELCKVGGPGQRVYTTRAVIVGVCIFPWPLLVTVCITYFSVAVIKPHN